MDGGRVVFVYQNKENGIDTVKVKRSKEAACSTVNEETIISENVFQDEDFLWLYEAYFFREKGDGLINLVSGIVEISHGRQLFVLIKVQSEKDIMRSNIIEEVDYFRQGLIRKVKDVIKNVHN